MGRRTRVRVLSTGMVAAAGVILALVPGAPALADKMDNWHVHDNVDKPAAFFPQILGEDLAVYLQDPAACPDATDKAFLPNGQQSGQPLRAGVCQTSDTLIHLRSIPAGEPAPEGWSLQGTDANGFSTYYLLTPRG